MSLVKQLTPQQFKIVKMLAEDKTKHQISKELGIKLKSVVSSIGYARRKLGVVTDLALVIRYKKENLTGN